MAEEQNVQGEYWNKALNNFLLKIMNWKQLGDSNIDIICPDIKYKVGIDSIFSYKRNPNGNQQIVIVEAKSAKIMDNISRSKIQEWIKRFIIKLTYVPNSEDFHKKFLPETDAEYHLGLLALWIKESDTYNHSHLEKWLSQLKVPRQRTPLNIYFISNQIIFRFCSIYKEIHYLKNQNEYKEISLFFPSYGNLPQADGFCFPIEALLSKFIFYKATMIQFLKGSNDNHPYEAFIVFYLGEIHNDNDFRFIELAIRDILRPDVSSIIIYTLYDAINFRNGTKAFKDTFSKDNKEISFKKLDVTNNLPNWLNEND